MTICANVSTATAVTAGPSRLSRVAAAAAHIARSRGAVVAVVRGIDPLPTRTNEQDTCDAIRPFAHRYDFALGHVTVAPRCLDPTAMGTAPGATTPASSTEPRSAQSPREKSRKSAGSS